MTQYVNESSMRTNREVHVYHAVQGVAMHQSCQYNTWIDLFDAHETYPTIIAIAKIGNEGKYECSHVYLSDGLFWLL